MYKDFIVETLKNAAEIARSDFGKVKSFVKPEDNNQVLTKADLEIGKLIVSEIQKTFPDHNIIDEEAGVIDKKSGFTWVVDPIDGTSNFANGVATYGTMLGLLKGENPIAGGISLPFFEDIYSAEKGTGAFKNDEKISVSKEAKLLNTLGCYQIDGHQENPQITEEEGRVLTNVILNIRNLRTSNSAFDVCMVAEGKYGIIANRTSKIWDNVAQHIIILEAGGVYTDYYGKEVDYSNPLTKSKDNFTYIAGPAILHKEILSIIKNS